MTTGVIGSEQGLNKEVSYAFADYFPDALEYILPMSIHPTEGVTHFCGADGSDLQELPFPESGWVHGDTGGFTLAFYAVNTGDYLIRVEELDKLYDGADISSAPTVTISEITSIECDEESKTLEVKATVVNVFSADKTDITSTLQEAVSTALKRYVG